MYQAFEFDSLDLDPHSPFFWDHVSRYWWASGQMEGKSVLDCACGKGYGSYILSQKARAVYGIDLNEKSLEIARSAFHKPSLSFRSFDVLALEKFEHPLDYVVAFEVIEHLPPAETDRFLGGIAKKLGPDGILLLSTPNHEVVTKSGVQVPDFHINNLTAPELRAALGKHFGSVTMLGQFRKRPWLQSLLFSLDFWNLRHSLRRPAREAKKVSEMKSQENKKQDLSPYLESCPEEVGNYRFSPWHWRQAGLTVAVCRQPIS
ncbi:MAG TPA: methyltransferase domain-containing protein [Bdellovibrionota bacterium]|jgi:SAM-dependent methyltransferase